MRWLRRVCAVGVLSLCLGFVGSHASANDAPAITPTADAYVLSSNPNANFGTGTKLWVEDDPLVGDSLSFLKFDLSQVSLNGETPCTAGSAGARLRLDVDNTSNGDHELYLTASSSWTETGITYNNMPSPTGDAIDVSVSTEEDSVNDVTEFIIPGVVIEADCDGILSFVIVGGSDDAVAWESREGTNVPQLIVDVGD